MVCFRDDYEQIRKKDRKGVFMLYRIESVNNPKVKVWKKLHTKKGRDRLGQFIIEGEHLITEALKSRIKLVDLLVTEHFETPTEWSVFNMPLTYVTDKVLVELSETRTPQGVLAICEQRNVVQLNLQKGKYLFLDDVQDPGNVGTMIRTADACGLDGVIVSEKTVDIYNGKVIRSTQGSLFHIPVIKGNLFEWVDACQEVGIPVFGTSLQGASDYRTVKPQEHFALIVGNEGEGVSETLLEKTDQNLYIPIFGQAESLNVAVACGILLYYLRGSC